MLTPGDRLGAYEIRGALGSGGMGVVYRAHDSRVGRDVAIKVAGQRFTHHFEREARAIAALNHPNVCALYDVGPDYLVLELIEGEPLRSPQPVADALRIARQLADALDVAHERGITHRDLKPSNIIATARGTVKVLDFGLARTRAANAPDDAVVSLDTDTLPPPESNARMGTIAYLAPECARGEPADKRADIWAFGVVLYELLTGRRPFAGRTAADLMTAIGHDEPDWSALPRDTPPEIHRLLRRCLEKDPQRRLPDIGVARLEIDDALATPAGPPRPRSARRWLVPAALAAALTMAVALLLWRGNGTAPSPLTVVRFPLPWARAVDQPPFPVFAVSPDGRRLVYAANGRLHERLLSENEPRPIAGTDSSQGISNPVFSPDGQSIAYFDGTASVGGAIKIIPATGGTAIELRRLDFPPFGMTWNAGGIVFARGFGQERKGVVRIAPEGGREEVLVDTGDDVPHGPQVLPDGDTLLFTLAAGLAPDRWDKARIVAHSLRTGMRTTVIEGGADGRYLSTGHLMFARRTGVFAARFDPRRLQITGSPALVIQDVSRAGPGMSGAMHAAVSPGGTLVYAVAPQIEYTLAFIARDGTEQRLPYQPRPYRHPRVAPDGKHFAVQTLEADGATIWVADTERSSELRRLTFGQRDAFPVWSNDGAYVGFASEEGAGGGIFRQRVDGRGGAERLTRTVDGATHVPEAWSPSGDHLLFREERGSRYSLWIYSFADRQARPFGVESMIPPNAVFSPDGQWVAYSSRDAAKFLIMVEPFPPNGTRFQAVEGGIYPAWSRDGRELFYFHGNNMFASVQVQPGPVFTTSTPTDRWPQGPHRAMMTAPDPHRGFDPVAGGKFLTLLRTPQRDEPAQLQVVVNWFHELTSKR